MGNKLLAPIGERPLLAHVMSACLDARCLSHVYVVLGHDAERVNAVLNENINANGMTVLINDRWPDGLSTSLHAALEALPEDAPGVLIVPGDMPFMTFELIDGVAETSLRTDRICFPTLDDRKGHPTAIPRRYFHQLLQVHGDVGARELIQSNWKHAEKLPVTGTDAQTQTDIDSADDLP